MSPTEPNTLHLSGEDEALAEFIATKSAGDTVELTVIAQVRETADGGAIFDVTSAQPAGYEEEAEMSPDDEAEAGMIGEILGAEGY